MDDFLVDKDVYWIVWFSIATVFFLIEIFTPTFIVIFFSGGALIAGALALLDVPVTTQVVVFSVSSILLLLLFRKKLPKVFTSSTEENDALKDSSENAIALVVEDIMPTAAGRIKFQGTFWNAEADEHMASGSVVLIISRKESDPNTFLVKGVKNG